MRLLVGAFCLIDWHIYNIINMYISKNFIYKDCMRKMTNWEECPELNEYRVNINDVDMKPDNFKWIRNHLIM